MTALHLDVHGSGANNVLLLHGSPTIPAHFDALAVQLAGSRTVLVAHMPGYGRSDVPPGPLSLDACAASIEDALIDRGIRELAVVGFSLGAYRAFLLAARKRLRVTHLVSLGGFIALDDDERAGFRATAAAVRAGDPNLAAALPARLLGPNARPAWIAEVRAWAEAAPMAVVAAELEAAAASADLTAACRALSIPVLARVGEHDRATPVPHSERIAAAAPLGKLEIVPGVGHTLLLEDAEATTASIVRALA